MGGYAAAGAATERAAKRPKARTPHTQHLLTHTLTSPPHSQRMGLGRSLLRADDRDDDDEDDDDEDGYEDEEEDESEGGNPQRAFEDVVARYEREADAAGAAERAARRKAAAAGGAYFATRRRAATSTASLAELDLAGAPRPATR